MIRRNLTAERYWRKLLIVSDTVSDFIRQLNFQANRLEYLEEAETRMLPIVH